MGAGALYFNPRAARARDLVGARLDTREDGLDFLEREVAQFDHKLNLAGNDVRGAGRDREFAHRADLPAGISHRLVANGEDKLRGGDQSVAPLRHRSGSRVIGESLDSDMITINADDPLDHTDRNAGTVE